jgi:hypothetical protein
VDNDQDNRAATEIILIKTACFAASVHRIVITTSEILIEFRGVSAIPQRAPLSRLHDPPKIIIYGQVFEQQHILTQP